MKEVLMADWLSPKPLGPVRDGGHVSALQPSREFCCWSAADAANGNNSVNLWL